MCPPRSGGPPPSATPNEDRRGAAGRTEDTKIRTTRATVIECGYLPPDRPMRLPLRLSPRLLRHTLAVAALFAQLVAATGAPVASRPPTSHGKSGGVAFPCQDHPCGCSTSEQGWAGDCCCFTLEQKLAWADANGVTPPPHVRPAVEARRANKSCCAKTAASCCEEQPRPAQPSVRWVGGVLSAKCRGDAPGGLFKFELIAIPAAPASTLTNVDPVASACVLDSRLTSTSHIPPTPPPRLA